MSGTSSPKNKNDSNQANPNKSATIPSNMYQNNENKKEDKPKKKSKLSFLSRKKNKEQPSQ